MITISLRIFPSSIGGRRGSFISKEIKINKATATVKDIFDIEKDLSINQLQESDNNLTQKIIKLKGELDNAEKLQRLLGKEREILLSQTVKLQREVENTKQNEEALRRANDDILQQLKKTNAELEVVINLKQEGIVNANEVEKRYFMKSTLIFYTHTYF
jgi:hypothetical protein